MIGVHAVILVAQGRFHSGVHKRPGYRNWLQRERYRCSDLTKELQMVTDLLSISSRKIMNAYDYLYTISFV